MRSVAGFAVAVCCVAPRAYADRQGFLSVPIELGGTTREDGRVSYGIRPELLLSLDGNRGFAYGGYLEVARSSADTSLGAGVTITYFSSSHLNLAPSVGAYHRFADPGETGLATGLFLGYRDPSELGGGDYPLGVRVDYRSDFSDHDEVVISVQADILFLAARWILSGYTPGRGM